MSENNQVARLLKLHNRLKKKQEHNWRAHWDDLAKYIAPFKDNVYGQRTPGEKTNNHLFDSTAISANTRLANALHTLLTNPSVKWFELTTGDSDLDKVQNVKLYLQKAEEIIRRTLNASNFQTEVHEVYIDLGFLGTAPLRMELDDETKVRFYAQPCYEIFIDEDATGRIDTASREYKLSIERIEQHFGPEALKSDELQRTLEENPDKEFEIVHIVKRTPKNSPIVHPFISYHILKKTQTIIKVGGFKQFPYAIPRWMKMSGEMYGRSQGMEVLPDVRTVNAMAKTNIQSAQLAMAPPLQGTDNSMVRPLQFKPFGMNWRRPGSDPITPINTGARPDIGVELLEFYEGKVKSGYLDKQLTLVENDRMTATEVVQRRDEQLRELSAILVRLDRELLTPVINRVFQILEDDGSIPEAPEELKDAKDVGIRYTSSIAKAQLSSDTENLNRTLNTVAPLLEAQPQIYDNIDGDAAFRLNASTLGVDQRFIRSENDVKSIRQERAELQQQQIQAEQAKAEAEVIQKAGPVIGNQDGGQAG